MKKFFSAIVACSLMLSFTVMPVTEIFAQTMTADRENLQRQIQMMRQGGTSQEELNQMAQMRADASANRDLDIAAASGQCIGTVLGAIIAKVLIGLVVGTLSMAKSYAFAIAADASNIMNVPTNKFAESFSDAMNVGDQTTADWGRELLRQFVNCILSELVRAVGQATVNWINNGFRNPDGSSGPAFLSNPEKFFKQIANIEMGNAIDAIAPFLCAPFRLDIQLGLVAGYKNLYNPRMPMCTLESIKNRWENFGSVDFWGDMIQLGVGYDRHTFLGAYFTAQGLAAHKTEVRLGNERWKLEVNNGFLGWNSCTDSNGKDVGYEKRYRNADGQNINQAQFDEDREGFLDYAAGNTNGAVSTSDQITPAHMGYTQLPSVCPEGSFEKINTPGTYVRDALSEYTPGGQYLSQTIDTVGETIDVILTTLVTQLTKMAIGKVYEAFR